MSSLNGSEVWLTDATSPHKQRRSDTYSSGWYVHSATENLVKKLLTMKIEATTAEMLAACRTHIAISDNMSSMGLTTSTVNAVQKFPKKSGGNCGNCTKPHGPGRQNCPARNSTCSFCHKQGHWVAKCRKAKKSKPGMKRSHNPQQQSGHQPSGHRKGGTKKTDEVGVSEGVPHCDEDNHSCLTSRPKEETQGPGGDHFRRHFHRCDDGSLCKCGDACCIKEEGQPSMQGGHRCRRKCDAPSSLWKTLPQIG